MSLWWLSFCDPARPPGSQFLGVAIVEPDFVSGLPGSEGAELVSACAAAHRLGCNPGGEVQGHPLPDHIAEHIGPAWRNRLLTRSQAESLDESLLGA